MNLEGIDISDVVLDFQGSIIGIVRLLYLPSIVYKGEQFSRKLIYFEKKFSNCSLFLGCLSKQKLKFSLT